MQVKQNQANMANNQVQAPLPEEAVNVSSQNQKGALT